MFSVRSTQVVLIAMILTTHVALASSVNGRRALIESDGVADALTPAFLKTNEAYLSEPFDAAASESDADKLRERIEEVATYPNGLAVINRFFKIETGLYRGAFPKTLAQVETLKAYGIKTILNISDNKAAAALEDEHARSLGIRVVHLPLDGWKAPTDAQTAAVQRVLNDKNLRPLFVHCTHGRERTGVAVAIYRVETDGWSPARAYQEMKADGFRTLSWNMRIYFKQREGLE